MRFCQPHWDLARELIEKHGLTPLVSRDGDELVERTIGSLQGKPQVECFDPLAGIHWHYTNNAVAQGGLDMIAPKPDGTFRCPVCEHVEHMPGFDARTDMEQNVVVHMVEYARENDLLPKVS